MAVQSQADDAPNSSDPPLVEQLRPLSTTELQRRAALLMGVVADSRQGQHQAALDAALAAFELRPRAERRLYGQPLPHALAVALTSELQRLKWPEKHQRPGLDSERYFVLLNRRQGTHCGTRHPHFELRRLCDEVIANACPTYVYTAIAVTKNFVGSPHTDAFDRSKQLAVALGDFEGGELCWDEDGGVLAEGQLRHSVAVVETRNRVASLDGRHVHWVRSFRGGDRYSLIFYNTDTEQTLGELQTEELMDSPSTGSAAAVAGVVVA